MSLQVKLHHKQLASVLSQVARAAGKKGIPVLSAVKIEDNGQAVDVTATDLQIYIRRRVPAVIKGRGAVCVSARRLNQILRLVPKTTDWINIEATDQADVPYLKVTWDNSEYILFGFPPATFPSPPQYEVCDMVLSVQTDVLRTLLKRTAWAAGTDESKPWLNGIGLTIEQDKARAVATDGVCIAWANCEVSITGGTWGSVTRIIPQETVKQLIDLLQTTAEAAVEIIVFEQRLFIYAGDLLVISNTLEGKYPDVMRLVPDNYPLATTVPREELLGAIKRLVVLATEGTFNIDIHPAEGMVLRSDLPEVGQAVERIPDVMADWSMTTAFNSRFFLKFLPLWFTPAIRCEFSNPRNPVRFTPEADDDYGAVVLPLLTY